MGDKMHGASYRYQFIACVSALDRDRRDDWSLSATEGKSHLMLTLKTLDAFQTTFAIDPRDLFRVAELIARQVGNLA
jgi:hypothetical protein